MRVRHAYVSHMQRLPYQPALHTQAPADHEV